MTPPTATALLAVELPSAVLARILQHVPQQQRLTVCALVCKAWAAAAAAATRSITLDSRNAARPGALPSFEAWLQQHGSNISSLEADTLPPASLQSILAVNPLLQLQALSLNLRSTSTATVLPALPTSLTRLHLGGSSLVQLPDQALDLTRLQDLELHGTRFKPRILFGMPQLQRLSVDDCEEDYALLRAAGDTQQPFPTLLGAIGNLVHLQQLKLEVNVNYNVLPVPASAFSALTASSQLQALHFHLNIFPAYTPGTEEIQHMFPDGRRLAQISSLVLGAAAPCWSWHVPGADLGRIAASCPNLRTLNISYMLEPEADLTPLPQFNNCKSLCVGGAAFGDSAAAAVAQLTQLTSLEWDCSDDADLSGVGLVHLTALTQLHHLLLSRRTVYPDNIQLTVEDALDHRLPLQLAPSVQGGSVWLQILRLLGVPDPVLDLMQERHQQSLVELQELRSRVAELEQQVLQAQALGLLPREGAERGP